MDKNYTTYEFACIYFYISQFPILKYFRAFSENVIISFYVKNLCQSQLLRVAMVTLKEGDFKYSISPSSNNTDFVSETVSYILRELSRQMDESIEL